MKRTALPLFEGFSQTPFERRLEATLTPGLAQGELAGDCGRGKTMGICDLRDEASRQAGTIGGRHYPVLAVTAPKNAPKEAALGNFLVTALGLAGRGHCSERQYVLFELLIQDGVEGLVVDDAHDLSMPPLIFLKDLTDPLQLSFSQMVGWC